MEKVYTKSEIVKMIEDLKTEEILYTDGFCGTNDNGIGAARRRHDCSIVIDTLNTVLYELDNLNPDE